MTMEVAVEAEPNTALRVPVTKAKSYVEINTGDLPEHVYREALIQGLKVLVNRGMTKLTKEAYPDPELLKVAAMEKAEETVQNMYDGKVRIMGGAKSDKVPREVMTEARRVAKALVKEELKKQGYRISYIASSDITKAANAYLAENPELIEQAKEAIEKIGAAKKRPNVRDIQPDQKKVKAAEAKKADKTLSAAKAGKVATRARPNLNA